jgi:hypothetical protein
MADSKEMKINYGSTYIEYKGYRIFYDYKPKHDSQWLITIHRGEPKPGDPFPLPSKLVLALQWDEIHI